MFCCCCCRCRRCWYRRSLSCRCCCRHRCLYRFVFADFFLTIFFSRTFSGTIPGTEFSTVFSCSSYFLTVYYFFPYASKSFHCRQHPSPLFCRYSRYRKLNSRLKRIDVRPYPRGFLRWLTSTWRVSDADFYQQVYLEAKRRGRKKCVPRFG